MISDADVMNSDRYVACSGTKMDGPSSSSSSKTHTEPRNGPPRTRYERDE